MVRVKAPCFGLDARGSVKKAIVFSVRRGTHYMRAYVVPHNPKTEAQLENRAAFLDGASKWRWGYITDYYKAIWNYYAQGTSETGYNRFMRYYLKANYNSVTKKKVTPQQIPSPQ